MSVASDDTMSRDPAPASVVPPARAGALLGDAVVLVWNDVADEGREQFYQWHDREHIPERLATPGFHAAGAGTSAGGIRLNGSRCTKRSDWRR